MEPKIDIIKEKVTARTCCNYVLTMPALKTSTGWLWFQATGYGWQKV
jgi:hypothetical protein